MQYLLCKSCTESPECLHRNGHAAVLTCKEFQPFETRAGRPTSRTSANDISRSHGDTAIGLCRNCGKRRACRFTKPNRKVLSCQEYE